MTWPRSPLPKPLPQWRPPKTKRGPSRDRTLPGKQRIRARRAAKKEES